MIPNPMNSKRLQLNHARPTGLHILPAIIRSQVYVLSRAIPYLLFLPWSVYFVCLFWRLAAGQLLGANIMGGCGA